jgi:RNA polymerase sigma factor for flagellar operon FliA
MTQAEVAYKTSAQEADDRNELVMQELSQVYYIAARIRERLPQQVEMEDLVNAGVLGLMEASRSFDSSKNAQFKTFAKFRIRGAILDSLRESDWGSRYIRRRGREILDVTARDRVGSESGRSRSIRSLSARRNEGSPGRGSLQAERARATHSFALLP